jgi:hypothetical protein
MATDGNRDGHQPLLKAYLSNRPRTGNAPIAAVFLGELAALNVLAFGDAGPADFAAVASRFVVAIVALVVAVMADLAPAGDEHETVKPAEAELTEDSKPAVQKTPLS